MYRIHHGSSNFHRALATLAKGGLRVGVRRACARHAGGGVSYWGVSCGEGTHARVSPIPVPHGDDLVRWVHRLAGNAVAVGVHPRRPVVGHPVQGDVEEAVVGGGDVTAEGTGGAMSSTDTGTTVPMS